LPYNDYQKYGTLFDRKTPWSSKENLEERQKKVIPKKGRQKGQKHGKHQ
jgi:hypothetical protein